MVCFSGVWCLYSVTVWLFESGGVSEWSVVCI